MEQDFKNKTNNETRKYTGNAFWDAPPEPVAVNTDKSVSEVARGTASMPIKADEPKIRPVITNTPESSVSNKKLIAIIAVAFVIIAVITGVVIFVISSADGEEKESSRDKYSHSDRDRSEDEDDDDDSYNYNSDNDNSNEYIADDDDTTDSDKEKEPEEEETISMPDCENRSYEVMKAELEDKGIVVEAEYAFSDDVSEGYIISQDISQGTAISADSRVIFTVSKGKDVSPYGYDQKLVVTASRGSSYGQAVLYEWKNGDWSRLESYNVTVGSNGIGPAKEGSSTSPEGLHRLGVILSSQRIDTDMNTYLASSNTCVVDDSGSSYYNQIMEKQSVPSGTGYDNIGKGIANGNIYAMIYIEHNGNGFSPENVVSGKGSAIGVRGQNGSISPTYGDVDMSASDMKKLISKLDADKNPMIELIVE